jgi:opacity protein-like surface antigen
MLRNAKEQIAKMTRFRMIGVALLAVIALSAVMASMAQAEEAPYFTIGGTRLVAGKTHNIDSRAVKTFTLTNSLGNPVIKCTGLGTEEAVLLGSNAGNPGKDNEISVFTGCTMTGNGAACKLAKTEKGEVTTTIKTEPTKSEQVENVEAGHVGKKLLEEFFPASKANGFVKLFFTGECTVFATTVSGQTVAEVVLDNASEGSVELGQTPQQRTSWLLRFPAAPITEVWLISGGVGKAVETVQTAFGTNSIQEGTALVLLAGTKFQPEPTALWSPLP